MRFDHIADNDGCVDFTNGWANTNQDGARKKLQKEWNQMQKESKKNKLKKMFDKDGELFARLVAEAIANGDAVPSAGAARAAAGGDADDDEIPPGGDDALAALQDKQNEDRASAAGLGGGGTGQEEEQDEEDDEGADTGTGVNGGDDSDDDDYDDDDDAAPGAGAVTAGARGNRAGGTGRQRGGAPTRGGAGAGGAGRGGGAHARGDGDEQLSNGDEDDAEESGGEMLFGGIIYVKRLDYYTPSIQLMFCYGWLCPRLLEPGVSFAKAYNTPGYEGMMGSTNANNVTRNCWLNSGRADWVRPHLMTFIRDAHAAAAVPGGPPLPPAVVGKALIELVRGSVRITAVPFLGSDDIEDYSFYNTNTGKVVESTEELLDQLRAALATRASTASSTSQVDAASPPDEHTGVEGGTGLVGNHENNNTTADPRMNFKAIGEIGRTTIVKTRKALTPDMIEEALSGRNIIKAEGSDPEYYAPVIQRLKSELVVTMAGGKTSVNVDAPALDAAWLHDGIKKMNRYYKDEKNQLQDYGGYLYDRFSAAVQAKDLVTMALCLRQVEVAEGNSGDNPFVCTPWYRQYEVDLWKDPTYRPAVRDTKPVEIEDSPKVYEVQSDDDEDDDGDDDGTGAVGTGGAGLAAVGVKAESDVEMEEAGEVGEERAVGAKSKAPEMEVDRDGRGDNMVLKRRKKTNGSAGDCNDGLRAVAGNSFAGAGAAMALGGDASNGEAAAAAASAVTGGTGGRKTTGEGGYDDMEEEKEEGGEDDGSLAIGTKIRKCFPECNSWHNGVIEAVPAPGHKSDYFHARYDDGDDEDLDESEAKEHAQCWKYWNATQSNGDHDTNGGSVVGANSGSTPLAAMPAMPAPSAVPIQDVFGVLAILVLPPSAQHGAVREALRNNPAAVAFAAASEEMAQQQATAAAGGALGSSTTVSAASMVGSGGLIGVSSEDDLLTMLADLPASVLDGSVLDGSVRDALRIDPSGLRLAAMAMLMLKERRQGQMQV